MRDTVRLLDALEVVFPTVELGGCTFLVRRHCLVHDYPDRGGVVVKRYEPSPATAV